MDHIAHQGQSATENDAVTRVEANAIVSVEIASAPYAAEITFADGLRARLAFLEEGVFRYQVDPSGRFEAYARPREEWHTARIPVRPDASSEYAHPKLTVGEDGVSFFVKAGCVTVLLDKKTGRMGVRTGDTLVMEEAAAVSLCDGRAVQTLVAREGEDFFGGGTQNGRFLHTGTSINIVNESNWVDGGVASPNPFFWSSVGYGVVRNTFSDGVYDFCEQRPGVVCATHEAQEFDAYFLIASPSSLQTLGSTAQAILRSYYRLTGNPVLLPEYAFYPGHLNAWNRDMWDDAPAGDDASKYRVWRIKGGEPALDDSAGHVQYERGGTGTVMSAGAHVESLNGHGAVTLDENIPDGVDFPLRYSARHRLDSYIENDIPLGFFLPNDGYGAGYGVNGFGKTGGVDDDGKSSDERVAAIDANVENLREFSDYAQTRGVATGLWTQSQILPDSNPDVPWQLLRDFSKEVSRGGVTTLKTDVAWVGPGYSFALDGAKTGYDIITSESHARPNLITLDGWAATQRYGAVWTGDQSGGNWEYIRLHVPTFIGQSLSGNPNVASDNDGIFGGHPIVATRDYQWKSFAVLMLDMDGWGNHVKSPQTHGDPYTGITRMYLKLKSSLMPYIYTTAASAANIDTGNGDQGLPIVRAIFLSDDSEYARGGRVRYEYTLGRDILVAPIYRNTRSGDANGGIGSGDDVRDGIYLPGSSEDVWIDLFSGEQYPAGRVINGLDAPLWRLPVFVRADAIIPMYEPGNNPGAIDRTHRIVEFFAVDGEGSYTQFEDDGSHISSVQAIRDAEYGVENAIDYGPHVSTRYTSSVRGRVASFRALPSVGTYEGYDPVRTTVFAVNLLSTPETLVATCGSRRLELDEAGTLEEFSAAIPADGRAAWFFDECPNLNYGASTFAPAHVREEGFSTVEIAHTPRLYVKFCPTDTAACDQALEVHGFENRRAAPSEDVDESLPAPVLRIDPDSRTPTSLVATWEPLDGACAYELLIDGMLNVVPAWSMGSPSSFLEITDLAYHSEHTLKIRQRTEHAVSPWGEAVSAVTLDDPWRNVPVPQSAVFAGGHWADHESYQEMNAFDHTYTEGSNMFRSGDANAEGQPLLLDYGLVHRFDKLVYWPRCDLASGQASCSGTVLSLRVETSVDGAHWRDCGVSEWSGGVDPQSIRFDGAVFARHVRLTPLKTSDGFFSALEIALFTPEGFEPFELGSLKAPGSVGSEDEQHLDNCIGRENHGTGVADWRSHVEQSAADFNLNGAYDVYDMSFTMSKLDGGTRRTGDVSGSICVEPACRDVREGQVVEICVRVRDACNVNAMGSLVHFDASACEFVKDSLDVSGRAPAMLDKSGHFSFGDQRDSVNVALVNKGDQELYGGTGEIATFKVRAKRDGRLDFKWQAWLIGPEQDFVSFSGA